MVIIFNCQSPDCGKPLRLKEEMAGKAIRCPACGERMKVPAGSAEGVGERAAPRGRASSGQGDEAPERLRRRRRRQVTSGSWLGFVLQTRVFGIPWPLLVLGLAGGGLLVFAYVRSLTAHDRKMTQLAANYNQLGPGTTYDEVEKLLGPPSDPAQAGEFILQTVVDPGNRCERAPAPGFARGGKPGGETRYWGPYRGRYKGKEMLGGSVVYLVHFAEGKAVGAERFRVIASLSDSTR